MAYVTVQDRQMYYEDVGAGFPLLFGHSYLWDAAMWESQVAELAQHYRCIVPELWGHGRSEPLPQIPYSLELLAEDHWALAQALGLERFAVVGLSVGGMWGVHLALNHPAAVAALVLMDTYVGAEPPATQARYFQMLDMVEKVGIMPPPIVQAATPFFFAQASLDQGHPAVAAFQQKLGATPAVNIPSVVALGRAIFGRASALERLGEIDFPTLVVVGADDRSRPPHEAQDMAAHIPHAQLEIIPDAGHICTVEQPARVNAVLTQFLTATL